MLTCFRRGLYSLILLLVAGSVIADPVSIKLLTIGNSFADNATRFLPQIAESQGIDLQMRRANIGGSDMALHVRHLEQALANPTDPEGKPYQLKDERFSLVEGLESAAFDFVTIQQVSYRSFDPTSYEPDATTLIETVKQHAPSAEILLHQTWAYRVDDPWFLADSAPAGKPNSRPVTQAEMYRRLTSAYDEVAARHGLRILPVGDAFQLVRNDPAWRFQFPDPTFDYDSPVDGTVPNQDGSLNVGWHWVTDRKTGERALRMDGHHASVAGCYLGACVWLEILSGRELSGEVWKPEELTYAQAASLRQMAHEAVVARNSHSARSM